MPSLLCFIDGNDVGMLLERLNADSEIAFIVPDGPLSIEQVYRDRLALAVETFRDEPDLQDERGISFFGLPDNGYRQRWKAVNQVNELTDGNHCLWHIPAGPLRLLTSSSWDQTVGNPWEGWIEERMGTDPSVPCFGPFAVTVIWLKLMTRHRPYSQDEMNSLPIVNNFWDREKDFLCVSSFGLSRSTGHDKVSPTTKRWWNRMKAWVGRHATQLSDPSFPVWAFPSAKDKLMAGVDYYACGRQITRSTP